MRKYNPSKIMVVGITVMLGLTILAAYLIDTVAEGYITQEEEYKSYLGKEVVIKGDTLEIVDYKSYKDVFILDDGREVNFNYIKNK